MHQGQALVFAHAGRYPGVYPHAEHVQGAAAVGLQKIHRDLLALHQVAQFSEQWRPVAKGLDKVVAGTHGEMADGHIPHAQGAPGDLIQRAVAAHGIEPQMGAAGLKAGPAHQFHPMARPLRHQDLIFQVTAHGHLAAEARQFRLPVVAARRRVDDKNMLHGLPLPWPMACL